MRFSAWVHGTDLPKEVQRGVVISGRTPQVPFPYMAQGQRGGRVIFDQNKISYIRWSDLDGRIFMSSGYHIWKNPFDRPGLAATQAEENFGHFSGRVPNG